MCREVEEYANGRAEIAAEKAAAEAAATKSIKIVKKLLDDGKSLEYALDFTEIDKETYDKYKDIV